MLISNTIARQNPIAWFEDLGVGQDKITKLQTSKPSKFL
jgi:hypothetical protein